MTAVAELVIAADPSAWERIGLTVADGAAQIGTVRLRFVQPHDRHGIVSWGLAGLPDRPGEPIPSGELGQRGEPGERGLHGSSSPAGEPGDVDMRMIDGVPTFAAEPPAGTAPAHRLGVVGFDHLVVMTSSLERTCAAIEAATGEPLKRVREAGSIRQGFHRLGEVVVEVVESAQHTGEHATLWGLVWNVADIHEAAAELGPEVVSLPKAAVQPGRYIASFRESVGLGLPVAMMSTTR